MMSGWNSGRSELLDAYDSIHWLTLTKWFYEGPDEMVWQDKRLWLHVACMVCSQVSIMMFKIDHLVWEENFFVFMVSLTGGMVMVMVGFRTYVLYTRLTSFRRLYFKPEAFNSNKHRPNSTLPRLIQVVKHCRKVGLGVIVIFVSFDVSVLVFPIIPPFIELARGSNQTYDELIPMYPSVNPVNVWWLRKEIKYAFDLTVAATNTIPWVGFVVIYYSVVNILREQHGILKDSLTHDAHFPDHDPLNMKLWIEDHAQLRKLVFELRDTMSPALGSTVVVNIFTLGLSMFQLTAAPIVSSDPLLVKVIFYFNVANFIMLSFCDLFIHCWLAAEITHCGIELMNAVYESEWYTKLKRPAQESVLPIMLCKKPIGMTGFGLITVTIATFTETVRLSYSYFTLITRT